METLSDNVKAAKSLFVICRVWLSMKLYCFATRTSSNPAKGQTLALSLVKP